MYDLILKSAQIVSSAGTKVGDIAIQNGKFVEIRPNIPGEAKETIDCKNNFVLPGLIDAHVHFRDPGFPEKEDFYTGSAAAAAGGVTSVIDMPNTSPPTLLLENLEEKRRIAGEKSIVNYGFYMALAPDNLEELRKAKNIAGIKVYMGSTTGDLLVQDISVIEELFSLGKLVIVHAEDEGRIREMKEKYKDRNDAAVHSLIRDKKAAYQAVRGVLHVGKKHNARVHITHVSSADEMREVGEFKNEFVSCDVTPHHLFLTEKAYEDQRNFVKINPPLRTEEDRQALWAGIAGQIIDMITTDHAPHTAAEKEQDYWKAPAGVPELETLLPLLLDAVHHGQLNLNDVVRLVAENPAKLFKITGKGKIQIGFDADFVMVDMQLEKVVKNGELNTKCNWSPYNGWKLKGWPILTGVNGQVVYKDGKVLGVKAGKELKFG